MKNLRFSCPKLSILCLWFCLVRLTGQAVDLNGNGLSDVWEQLFQAGSLTQLGDEDGDGFSNMEECLAGTDPFDPESRVKVSPMVSSSTNPDLFLKFDTIEGKFYQVQTTQNLSHHLIPFGNAWFGDGLQRAFYRDQAGNATSRSPVRAEFWADVSDTSFETFESHPRYPDEPDGIIFRSTPTAPIFQATGYAARMSSYLAVPETGLYRLYLSSGGPAEFYLQTDDLLNPMQKMLEILPTQAGLLPGEWTTYDTQQTEWLLLEANRTYRIELRYLGTKASQHCALAWSGPGIDGIQPIGSDQLARIPFRTLYLSPLTLMSKTYEESDPSVPLWPTNTTVISAPVGMTGKAERFTGDPGGTTEESIVFSSPSAEHLYATWMYQFSPGHDDLSFLISGGVSSSLEGPRIRFDSRDSGTVAAVRAGGPHGYEVQIDTRFNHSYRVEVVSTLSEKGFDYMTPQGPEQVEKERFDLYVSDPQGHLIGSAKGLTFRDADSGTLSEFAVLRAGFFNTPNLVVDDLEVTSGHIRGKGYLIAHHDLAPQKDDATFYNLKVVELDQDGDGVPDWEELILGEFNELLFFDPETKSGIPDESVVASLVNGAQGVPEISLFATDADAYESNYPNTIPNHGEITVLRSGNMGPLRVSLCVAPLENTGTVATVCDGTCCSLVGSAGDEEAEPEDYTLVDEDGNKVTDHIDFAFGEVKKVITVQAVNDQINEYPETLNLAIEASASGSYTLSENLNGASIQLFDLPDSADNLTLFTGTFRKDGNAVTDTNGAGFVTATINGPRTEIRIWDEFSSLTSAQQDSHIHKSNIGNTPGPIIYSITETPGDETTDPLNGPLVSYPWDLTSSSGAVPTNGGAASKQVIIDSLFGQNNETPLYINIHTLDNPAGEIWAFLGLSGGTAEDPGNAPPAPAPGSSEYPLLAGRMLEIEVRRFLNQATFGATDAEVNALIQTIEQARLTDPTYHRMSAFSDWIDEQMTLTDQSYLLEYVLASHYQYMTLAHMFDPILNPPQGEWVTPNRPVQWPQINRDSPNPEHWYLDGVYPVDRDDFRLSDANDLRATPSHAERRDAHWQMMMNARDQLRQKMGFALQQIVVVSDSLDAIEDTPYGSANYQDMLNYHAFGYYRDVLGYVNWSPLMGKWLSSLQNQKAIDFDGDGLYDSFPDENLARENMQLFSIGLFDLWSDGSLKLSPEGLPRATYTNEDIREFAKILTGQSFSRYNGYNDIWGGVPFAADNQEFDVSQRSSGVLTLAYLYPMKMFGDYHSSGPKSFAGVTIDNSSLADTTLEGIADIEQAMDWLAGKPGDGQPDFDMIHSHTSTPAFISRRLIQRFTTSNPSKEYLHRVATVFKTTEGDLGETLRAILLDPEARTIDLENTAFGMKKSPLEGYLQMLRALEGHSYIPLEDPQGAAPYTDAPGDFSRPDIYLSTFGYSPSQLENQSRNIRLMMGSTDSSGSSSLQMNPFGQDTVFNFYLPDYSPGGIIGNSGLLAPEMQMATEQGVVRNINYFHSLIRYGLGGAGTKLGGSSENQMAALGGVADTDQHGKVRFSKQALANAFYPSEAPESQLTNDADGKTTSVKGSDSSAPVWLRVARTGNVFVTSESSDGMNWAMVEQVTLPMAAEAYIGLAVTSHEDGILTTAEFSNLSMAGGQGTWYSRDIGSVSATGSSTLNTPTSFTIEASGADIWNTNDEFHYLYQHIDGDADLIVRVDSLELTHEWAKAGVMIRENLESYSSHVSMMVSGSNGTRSHVREIPRGRSSESLGDELLVDALDLRLTNGLFKLRYPYDPSDDDDPAIHGPDKLLQNPREILIDALTEGLSDPFDGNNDDRNRVEKLEDALYILTSSPEYQIRK